ncbi:hypothetical protein M9Y10_012973 [Tritrichomonas musculus]|uniref:Protein kinase domain-containing protein n=1 Tax=Tritrichomonas musculus TaxID=1915356 RepID=A0ABR2I6T9_9EUKA
MSTKQQISDELNHICNEIERLSLQTVAHQKKFQYSINQFRTFCEKYAEHIENTNSGNVELNPEEVKAFRSIVQACRDYAQTFSLNMGNSWANNFLSGPSVSTATDLNTITANLHELAEFLDPDAAAAFDPQSPQWLRFHILDLRAIKESLKHYVTHADQNDKALPIMRQKLDSIDSFFKEYEDENIVQGARIFSPIPIQSQNWVVQHTDFTCELKEGQGVSAIVYYGHMVKTNEEVAVKQLKFKKLNGPKLRSFQREIMVLANAIHPCVLRFVGATDSPPFCIITEWMGGGSLYHELHKYHRLDNTQLTICAIDIARGMQFLHSRHIIHRDLKSLNVLLDTKGYSKICDFGFARQSKKEDLMTKNVGTPHWMAPELLGGSDTYNEKVDVYAYGIVLWEILTGDLPYNDLEPTQIIGQVLLHDARPYLPPTSPPDFRALIEKCWARDPKARPSFDEIMKIWRQGKIMIPGSNQQQILNHLKESLNENEKVNDDIENQLNSAGQNLNSLYSTFQKSGIPEDIVNKCWENIQTLHNKDGPADNDVYYKCCVMFLSTTLALKASSILRQLQPGLLSNDIAASICNLFPTGNDKLDTDLLMISCKNGLAAKASLHAVSDEHIMIAFEVISRSPETSFSNGNEDLRNEVISHCVKCLSLSDADLTVSALRCLIAINEAKKIPIEIVKMHLQSRNITLKMASYIAAAKMAQEGIQLPNEFLDIFIEKWNSDLVGTAIVSACKNLKSAQYILERVNYGTLPPIKLATKIIIQAYKHEELRPALKAWLEHNPYEVFDPNFQRVANIVLSS